MRILAIDPPGYGDSAAAGDPAQLLPIARWDAWCRSLARELQKRCSGRIVLAGNSSGGVAATLTAHGLERCAGLVLVCWCDWRGHRAPDSSVLCPRDRAGVQRLLERAWHKPPALSPSALNRVLEQSRRQHFIDHVSSFDSFRYRTQLAAFAGSLVLIGGERDGLVPLAALHETALARGCTPIHVVRECGHYPHRERQHEFTTLLAAVTQRLVEADDPSTTRTGAGRPICGVQHGTELEH